MTTKKERTLSSLANTLQTPLPLSNAVSTTSTALAPLPMTTTFLPSSNSGESLSSWEECNTGPCRKVLSVSSTFDWDDTSVVSCWDPSSLDSLTCGSGCLALDWGSLGLGFSVR